MIRYRMYDLNRVQSKMMFAFADEFDNDIYSHQNVFGFKPKTRKEHDVEELVGGHKAFSDLSHANIYEL